MLWGVREGKTQIKIYHSSSTQSETIPSPIPNLFFREHDYVIPLSYPTWIRHYLSSLLAAVSQTDKVPSPVTPLTKELSTIWLARICEGGTGPVSIKCGVE